MKLCIGISDMAVTNKLYTILFLILIMCKNSDMQKKTKPTIQPTLQPMGKKVPCKQCPTIYLPVCSVENGTLYKTHQNRCLFVCKKNLFEKEVRRGICIESNFQ